MSLGKILLGAGVIGGGLWAWSNSAKAATMTPASVQRDPQSIDGMVFPPEVIERVKPAAAKAKAAKPTKDDTVLLPGPLPIRVPKAAAVKAAKQAKAEKAAGVTSSNVVDITDAQAAKLKLDALLELSKSRPDGLTRYEMALALGYAQIANDPSASFLRQGLAQRIMADEQIAKQGGK